MNKNIFKKYVIQTELMVQDKRHSHTYKGNHASYEFDFQQYSLKFEIKPFCVQKIFWLIQIQTLQLFSFQQHLFAG